jgi:hypothetical protein
MKIIYTITLQDFFRWTFLKIFPKFFCAVASEPRRVLQWVDHRAPMLRENGLPWAASFRALHIRKTSKIHQWPLYLSACFDLAIVFMKLEITVIKHAFPHQHPHNGDSPYPHAGLWPIQLSASQTYILNDGQWCCTLTNLDIHCY